MYNSQRRQTPRQLIVQKATNWLKENPAPTHNDVHAAVRATVILKTEPRYDAAKRYLQQASGNTVARLYNEIASTVWHTNKK